LLAKKTTFIVLQTKVLLTAIQPNLYYKDTQAAFYLKVNILKADISYQFSYVRAKLNVYRTTKT